MKEEAICMKWWYVSNYVYINMIQFQCTKKEENIAELVYRTGMGTTSELASLVVYKKGILV